jgi:membrane-associated phospholipid phosphatase
MAAVYDLGCALYFLVPTAPPWWASEEGYTPERVERVMIEVGEEVWGDAWPTLYGTLGGNPWAAMPSLHFATSLMAAILLAETDPIAGALGWGYALTLGFALVYLGEHYLADLLAGAALVALVRRGEPIVEPLALRLSAAIQRLEETAEW